MSESTTLHALTLQMLAWLEERPHTYGDTMEAWRTSCPGMPVWEDAVGERLVEIVPRAGAGMNGSAVRVTEQGRMLLVPQECAPINELNPEAPLSSVA